MATNVRNKSIWTESFFPPRKNQLSAYSIRKLNLKKAIERKKRQKNALMVLCRLEIKTHSWINRYYWMGASPSPVCSYRTDRLAFHLSIIIICCVDVWTGVNLVQTMYLPMYCMTCQCLSFTRSVSSPIKSYAYCNKPCLRAFSFRIAVRFDHQFRSIKFQWHKSIYIDHRKLCDSSSFYTINMWFRSVIKNNNNSNSGWPNWTQSQCAWLM